MGVLVPDESYLHLVFLQVEVGCLDLAASIMVRVVVCLKCFSGSQKCSLLHLVVHTQGERVQES